jgi:hypothetical protein
MPTRPRALAFNVSIDAAALLDGIDKELADLENLRSLQGQLINTATGTHANNKDIALFTFLDRGTRAHIIEPSSAGYLADRNKDFIIRSAVEHPGTPPFDISARALTYFQQKLEQKVAGPSTRSLARRTGQAIDFSLVKQIFVEALQQTRDFAASITPNNWFSVKRSYEARVNGRRV